MKKHILAAFLLIFLAQAAGAENVSRSSSLDVLPAHYQNTGQEIVSFRAKPWLKKISDPQLNDIIANILQYNATLNKMVATISRLKAEYGVVQSNRYPSLDLDMTAGSFGTKTQTDGYYGVSLPASYELDVWSRLQARRQAAFTDIEAAKEDKTVLAMTLVAEAMEAYYRGLYLNNQIRIHKEAIAITEEIKKLKEKQYSAGLIAKEEFLRSERQLREFSAIQADLEAQLIRAEHVLKAMMGEYPADGWLKGDFDVPEYLDNIVVGLPSELVEQRPDVLAQQSRLEAAGFRIEAARRELYPRITLTAAGTKSSLDSQQLIDGVFGSWGVFARVSIPIFDGERRSSEVKVEESQHQEALEEYKSILLQAFKEVEDALAEGNKQAYIVGELKKHEDSLRDIYALSNVRYAQGIDSAVIAKERYLDVLRINIERNKAEAKLVSNRIQLLRALGGEW